VPKTIVDEGARREFIKQPILNSADAYQKQGNRQKL
jgi:hypothetical protein